MQSKSGSLSTLGLFAGIGGIELGLSRAGHATRMICEIDDGAAEVLRRQFKLPVEPDIRKLKSFPKVDLIAAGFPCQDLSQAGRAAGIRGGKSSIISEVFSRLRSKRNGPRWLLLENVPFMLQLQRGAAMRYVVDELEELGFAWAYRVVNTKSFGLPQRRRRVLLLASRTEDPRGPLFGCDAGERSVDPTGDELCGFYWTEGRTGLGWAVDTIPTLKGGSALGIPSAPAIWDPLRGTISVPDLRDAERLQGFPVEWTAPAGDVPGVRGSHRWKLIGNAVSVPVAEWIGERLKDGSGAVPSGRAFGRRDPWPHAAWGSKGKAFKVDVSAFPIRKRRQSLRAFLQHTGKPLSYKASVGFLNRALRSQLKFEQGFLADVRRHADRMQESDANERKVLRRPRKS